MNLKRTFRAILTMLGIIGLIYTGISIINHNSLYNANRSRHNWDYIFFLPE